MDIDTPILTAFILFFLAGLCDGTAETLKFHPYAFFIVFKNANRKFWDMEISWLNKYKNRDITQGPRFWQSDKAMVFLTDGYHLMRWIKNNLIILASMCFLSVSFISGSELLWYMIPIAYSLCYCAYTLGFTAVYEFLFGYKKS